MCIYYWLIAFDYPDHLQDLFSHNLSRKFTFKLRLRNQPMNPEKSIDCNYFYILYNNPHRQSKFHRYRHKFHSVLLKGLQVQSNHQDIYFCMYYLAYLKMEYHRYKLHICLMCLYKIRNLNNIFGTRNLFLLKEQYIQNHTDFDTIRS